MVWLIWTLLGLVALLAVTGLAHLWREDARADERRRREGGSGLDHADHHDLSPGRVGI